MLTFVVCITRPKGRVRIETLILPVLIINTSSHHPAERPGAD